MLRTPSLYAVSGKEMFLLILRDIPYPRISRREEMPERSFRSMAE